MKGTIADWRKMTLAGMVAQKDALELQRDAIDAQVIDMRNVIAALSKINLNSKPTRQKREVKPGSAKQVHWTKKPNADPNKVAAWRKRMAKIQKLAIKAKAAKRGEVKA